tara:strand:+ start:1378 stop:4026 length:2649 start_codon:yes stop_codon:yes gene_type:complete
MKKIVITFKQVLFICIIALVMVSTSNAQGIILNGEVSAEGNQIKNLGEPEAESDATTKNYVDSYIAQYFPNGISLGDEISWIWNGTSWEPAFSQQNDNILNLVSEPGSDTQIVCEFESIIPIQYLLNTDNTGIVITGLPSGIGYAFSDDLLTISGDANQDVSAQTTFNYTVTVPTQDSNVNTVVSGTIVVVPKSTITLDSGELNQSYCLGEPITPISFVIDGESPNATVNGLPEGVSATISGNMLIISGTPPTSLISGSSFDFIVQTNSSACEADSITGVITVTDCSTCFPSISAGADFAVCANDPYNLQGASAANFDSIVWTSNGSGAWDNVSILSPTYVPSNADVNSGQVTLTLTAINDQCDEAQTLSDDMILTLTQCNSIEVTVENNDQLEMHGNSLIFGAQVNTENMQNINQVGICYSTSVGPTVDDASITENNAGSGWWVGANPSYELTATGLSPNTTYYVRAFAKTINDELVYGDQVEVVYQDPNIAELYNFTTTNSIYLNEVLYDRLTNIIYVNAENVYLQINSSAPTNRNIKIIRFPNTIKFRGLYIQNDMSIESLLMPEVIKFNEEGQYSNEFIIKNTQITSMSFPALERISMDGMYIQNNNKIENIDFPVLNKIEAGNFYIENNENLSNLNFDNLVNVLHNSSSRPFSIRNNPELTLINFPNLININHSLNIYYNAQLLEINAPEVLSFGLKSPTSRGLYINNNISLNEVNFNSLQFVYNEIRIQNNNNFDVSTISNCNFFVVVNDGFNCNFGTVNISENLNNDYCFQDSSNLQPLTLTTNNATNITQTTASSGGSIISPQETIMIRKGLCWSVAPNPTVEDNNFSSNGYGNEDFDSYIFDLLPNTTYHYRAYAEDCNGVFYGNEMSFTTPE